MADHYIKSNESISPMANCFIMNKDNNPPIIVLLLILKQWDSGWSNGYKWSNQPDIPFLLSGSQQKAEAQ